MTWDYWKIVKTTAFLSSATTLISVQRCSECPISKVSDFMGPVIQASGFTSSKSQNGIKFPVSWVRNIEPYKSETTCIWFYSNQNHPYRCYVSLNIHFHEPKYPTIHSERSNDNDTPATISWPFSETPLTITYTKINSRVLSIERSAIITWKLNYTSTET